MTTTFDASESWAKFATLSETKNAIQRLADTSQTRQIAEDETVISQGDTSSSVYLVVSGYLKGVRYSKNGHEIWIASYGPMSLIGEMSGLINSERSSAVVCEEDAVVLSVDYSIFEEAMLMSPEFSMSVAKMLATRLKTTTTQLEELATLQTSARLHSELIRLGTFDQDDDEIVRIDTPPSVSELAIRIYAARESTSRAFSALQKRGFLQKNADGSLRIVAPRNPA